jgi:hypothetical protein
VSAVGAIRPHDSALPRNFRYVTCATNARECLRLLDSASCSIEAPKAAALRDKVLARLFKCAIIERKRELADGYALDAESSAALEASLECPLLPPGLQPQRSTLPFMRCAAMDRSREYARTFL